MRYKEIRDKLSKREKELSNLLERIDQRTKVPLSDYSGELSAYDNHTDLGTDLYMRETDQVIRHRAKQSIEELKLAQEALEQGTYGICDFCGKLIDTDRLTTLPESRYCFHCANENFNDELILSPQGYLKPNEFWDEMAVWGSSNTIQDGQDDVEEIEDKPR